VTSYHVQLSDGQEFTVIADAAQRRSAAERSTTTAARRPTSPIRAAREVHDGVESAGGVLAWLVNTGASAVIGLVVGAVVVALMHLLSFGRRGRSSPGICNQ
jgi:predicted DNA repair protein MutK